MYTAIPRHNVKSAKLESQAECGTDVPFVRPTPDRIGLSGAADTLYKTVRRPGFGRKFWRVSSPVDAVVAVDPGLG